VTHTNLEQDFVSRHIVDNLLDFEHVNERICKIRVKIKYYNL